DGRRGQLHAAPELGDGEPPVRLELVEESTVDRVERLRFQGRCAHLPSLPRHVAVTPVDRAYADCSSAGRIVTCGQDPRPTSSAARSSTTSGLPSPCSCSRASLRPALPGSGSQPPPRCSPPGGGRGGSSPGSTRQDAVFCSGS